MRSLANILLYLLIVAYYFNSDFFERTFFINELLSLISIPFFILFLIKERTVQRSNFHLYVFWFILICLAAAVLSIPVKTNWYYYARNTVILYSAFTFFLGYYFFPTFHKISKGLLILFRLYVVSGLLYFKGFLARYSGPILFPLAFYKRGFLPLALLTVLVLIHGVLYDALSILILIPILIGIVILPNYRSFQWSFFLTIAGFIAFYIVFQDNIVLYKEGGYRYFGNVTKVYASNPIFALDHNTSWRIILWYRFIVERFPENLLGVGFGTPLLTYKPEVQTASMVIDEVHAHVSGAHNSFITLFVRLGILGVTPLLLICSRAFRDYYKLRAYPALNQYQPYYIIWIFIFAIGLFNLSLESPLRASVFWICTGFLARIHSIAFERKK